jgi:hypothetical protein
METTLPSDPWSQRPRCSTGDPEPTAIFYAVGLALTLWETVEGAISVAYIGLIATTRYHDDKYFKTASFEKRHKLVKRAIELNVNQKDCGKFETFIDLVLNYSPRRHEIAHGRVFNMGERGFCLGPNMSMARNFPDGLSTYQYTASDIVFYCGQFAALIEQAERYSTALCRR